MAPLPQAVQAGRQQAWALPPPGPPPQEVQAVLERVQGHVFERRIRVKDIFFDFDPLRSGRCTQQQFQRAVNQIVPTLSHDESRILAVHFTEVGPHVHKPQVVSYLKFVKAVDDVFATADLEKYPKMRVPKPGEKVQRVFTPAPLDDEAAFDQILRKIALLTKTRGIVFRACFQDCERGDATSLMCPRFSGKVTHSQFLQHFPYVQDFTERELRMIVSRYATEQGDVHCAALDRDVTAIIDEVQCARQARPPMTHRIVSTAPRTPKPGATPRRVGTPSNNEVVGRVKALIAERRVPLHGAFLDFDRLRRGVCTPGQAMTVFTILHIDLDNKEMQALTQLFCDHQGNFHYRDFVDAMSQAPPTIDFGAPPSSRTCSRMTPPYLERERKTPFEEAELEEAELLLAKRVRQWQLPLKNTFQDFDRTRNGRVTRSQFMRIMDVLQFQLSEEQADIVFKAYCDPDDPSRFLYPEFCASVRERSGETSLMFQTAMGVPFSARTGRPPKYFNMSGQVMRCSPVDIQQRPFTR